MKRLISFLLICILILGLVACVPYDNALDTESSKVSEDSSLTDQATDVEDFNESDKDDSKDEETNDNGSNGGGSNGDVSDDKPENEAQNHGEILKVMSYNVKNGYINAARKKNTIEDVMNFMPDTLGVQEFNKRWLNAFTEGGVFNEYGFVGEQRYGDRDQDANDNEYSAILYRKSKFRLLDSGTYWLSETPETPDTKLVESKYVRIMTYAVLERISDGAKFVHVNTHLNTTPSINLRQVEIMVELVNEKIYSKHGQLPTFYTGDFNIDPSATTNNGYKYLISTGTENARDAAEATSDENTIKNGGKIDHCVVTKGDFNVAFFDVGDLRADSGENDTSNHFPIYIKMYIALNGDSTDDLPKHIHEYAAVVTESTEALGGYTTNICSCGAKYISDRVPKKVAIPLVANDVAKAKIVMASDADRYVWYARDRIQLSVNGITGISLLESGSADIEIHIGDTGDAESVALKATLGADEFAIKLLDNKIIIVASNPAFLYEAAKCFVDNYLKSPNARVGENEITLLTDDINVKQAGNKASMNYQLTKGEKFTLDTVASYTLNNQQYGAIDANPRIYRRQGGCFTGEVYYQVLITKNEDLAVVARKNVKTGELIYSEPRLMEHANDATYDPYNNRLIVGNTKTIWIYDGDTLEFIESKTLSHATSRISYSAERHTYIMGSYYFYDDSFTYTNKYVKSKLSTIYGDLTLSSQGTACDDVFIYSLLIESTDVSGKYNAHLGVLDWYGNTLAFITVNIEENFEPENVSVVDGKLYIAACSTQPVATLYEIKFA